MTTSALPHNHVAIIGTGLGGLASAIRLRQPGFADIVLLERAGDVGGVRRDNDYPGAAVDVQSDLYSLSFAPNPAWPSTYANLLHRSRCQLPNRWHRERGSGGDRAAGRTRHHVDPRHWRLVSDLGPGDPPHRARRADPRGSTRIHRVHRSGR